MSSAPKPWRIPLHWCWSTFAHAAEIAQDLVDPALVPDMPHIAPNNIGAANRQLLSYATVKEDKVISPKQRFRPNQILFTKIRPYLLKSVKVDFEGVCSADMYPLWARPGVDPDYLLYWITSPDFREIIAHSQGRSVLPKINQSDLNVTPFPMPSTGEQRRIVSKIDSLSAKSKRVRDRLDHIPCLVEKYKQAVLVAAFNGLFSLNNAQGQSGHKLVEHVRKQHEALHRSRQGKCPPCLDPDRYMFEIHATWAWAAAEEIVEPGAEIVYGIVQPGPKLETGVPYVRGTDIENGRIKVEQLLYTSPEIAKKYDRASLKSGDVLLGIIRATKVAVVPPSLDGANITQGTARLRPSSALSTKFLAYWLDCEAAQTWLHSKYRGIDMPGLNLRDVRRLPIPIPPRSEQIFIVGRIETAFECINRLAAEATSARALIDRLDQAILAKAFRGELVPQDPADEPASVLLERIRAERAAAPRQRRGRRSEPDPIVA